MRIDVGDIHSTVITPDFKAIGWVRRVCRARPNGYFFMPKYKKGVWDGYVSLMAGPTSFPTGLLGMVVGDLRKRGYSVEVHGLPPRNLLQAEANLLKGIALRDYQLRAVNKLLDAGRGVAKMATNSGKTEVMAALVKVLDRQSIVLVHRKELLYQTQQRFQKRLGVPVGIIGDSENKPQRITIAMIQTLANKLNEPEFKDWIAGNEVLLVDECFPAGTLVDGVPIENISIGDTITAYDECNKVLTNAKVTRKFVNNAPEYMMRITVGSTTIICTENHPIMTNDGWVPAKLIAVGSEVLVNVRYMRNMRQSHSNRQVGDYQEDLFPRMFEPSEIKQYEGKQELHTQTRSTEEIEAFLAKNRVASSCTRRQREAITKASAYVSGSIRMGYGSCSTYQDAAHIGIPHALQNRHSQQRIDDWYRSRWSEPLYRRKRGQEKGGVLAWIRVDNVEILESGSDGRFGGLCPDGKVYNIEVESLHTYTANGIVVHNCHNASSDQFMKVLSSIPGHWRYGFSGTPLKYDDLADLQLMAATGRIIVDVGNEQLIQQGYSAKPIIHVHIVEDLQEANDDMPFSEAYDRFIVHNEQRNAIIKEVASEVTGITLIIVSRVEHGTLLNKLIPGSTFVSGGHSTERRQRVLDEMRQGTPGAYIATNIFDEGVDVPNVNTLVLAAGGKSHVRILQRVGRGLRQKTDGDNIVNIHDFIDDTNKHLIEHSEERMKVYEDEGFDFRIHESSSGTVL